MNEADRLNLRARQILDDPALGQNQRIANAGGLFKQIVTSTQADPTYLDAIVAEISDDTVRAAMQTAVLSALSTP